ncbi:MAG: T9SS type A sorting domain-containing protein [Vicingaceae bacterium]|nr:T9SS type A sorting domain-containing protein [Vicingaceae bacterium]
MIINNIPKFFNVLFVIIFTISCNQSAEEDNQVLANTNESEKIIIQSEQDIVEETSTSIEKVIIKEKPESSKFKKEEIPLRVTKSQLDSMNQITPVYDSYKYDGITVDYFTNLSSELGGKPFYVEYANQINSTLMEILSTRLNDQTDVVLLIDKTGSMADDWEVVKNSLNEIMDFLKDYNNVRLGIASYGDKNYHLDFWYNMEDLSYDINKLQDFMDTYSTMGNPDTRESVNDAIVKTVNNMSWNQGSNRIMIIIGDAPSQLPPLSAYSFEDVISICKSQNVLFNLYPVIISSFRKSINEPPLQTNIAKFYPNPAVNNITIETNNIDALTYEIIDLTGKVIKNDLLHSNIQTIDISHLPPGTYLLHIFNENLTAYYSGKIIKE